MLETIKLVLTDFLAHTDFYNWLKILSVLSVPAILIVTLLGLRQIKLVRKQVETSKKLILSSSKRESYKFTLEQCKIFSDKVVPLDHRINEYIKKKGITLFDKAILKNTDRGLKVDLKNIKIGDLAKLREIKPILSEIINSAEVFSLCFLKGIADEEVGFHSQGQYFIELAEHIAIIVSNSDKGLNQCKHIWPLYRRWKDRYEQEKLHFPKSEIEKKLQIKNSISLIKIKEA